ncbi:MAG: hypothetical protein JXK16_00120 [Thiotrichales bacterium]|nr:hypothetical protein [Thiotrichales bacterium]
MKNIIKMVIAVTGVAIMTGCSVIPHATQEERTDTLKLMTTTDKATVYTIRGEKGSYKIHELPMIINGTEIKTYGNSFSKTLVKPGKGTIETDMHQIIGNDTELEVDFQAGKNYFYEVSMHFRPLIGPGTEIVPHTKADALKLMENLPLIK